MATATKATKTGKLEKSSEDKIHIIPLSDIDADWAWNSRAEIDRSQSGSEERTAFAGLLISLAKEGQDTPVRLFPNPDTAKGAKKYCLAAGFQRLAALKELANPAPETITLLNKEGELTLSEIDLLKTKIPTVEATIDVDMTPATARRYNLRENLLRSGLHASDICFGVSDILSTTPQASSREIAAIIGRSQDYANDLTKIAKTVNGKLRKGDLYHNSPATTILEAWRRHPVKPTIRQMIDIGGEPDKETQRQKYLECVNVTRANGDAKKKGPGAWVPNAAKDAARIGDMLGTLERARLIRVDAGLFTEDHIADLLLPLKRLPAIAEGTEKKPAVTSEQYATIAQAAAKAFSDALAGNSLAVQEEARKAREKADATSTEEEIVDVEE